MSKDSASKKPTADPVKSGAGEKKPQVIENKDNGAAANAQKPKTQQQPQKKQTTEKANDGKGVAKPGSEKLKDGVAKASSPPQKAKDVKPEAKVGVQTSPVKEDKNSAARSPVKVENKEFVREVIIERGVSGTVSWFNSFKGFGFIDRKDKDERIFVHCTAIVHANPRAYYGLQEGEEVEFDIVHGTKGFEAAGLSGPGGRLTGFRLRAPPLGRRGPMPARFSRLQISGPQNSRPQNGRPQNGRPLNGRPQNGRNRRNTENTKNEESRSVTESESESDSSEYTSVSDKSEEKKVVADQRKEQPKNSGDGKQLPPKPQQQQKKPEPKAAQKQDVKAGQGAQKQTAKK